MEEFFLNLGLPYTWSKLLPFILLFIFGILLAVFLHKVIYKKVLNIILTVLGFIAPVAIYFALHPIYQGDLNDSSRAVKKEMANELQQKTLYVISIPGCPWCKLAMKDMKALQERNPKLKVQYIVLSKDENHLKFFKEELPSSISIQLANEPVELSKVAQGEYPTFAIVEKDQILTWSNSEFGAYAWDRINTIVK